MAQKTTLVPSGIPGQVYGSFAGKTVAVATLLLTGEAGNAVFIENVERRVFIKNVERRVIIKDDE